MLGMRCFNIELGHFFQDLPTQPALVVVFFGANDAAVPVPSGKGQAVPIDEFKGNLIKIASYLNVELPVGCSVMLYRTSFFGLFLFPVFGFCFNI